MLFRSVGIATQLIELLLVGRDFALDLDERAFALGLDERMFDLDLDERGSVNPFSVDGSIAADSGSNGLSGTYHNVVLGGGTNRAWFNGSLQDSMIDIYSAGLDAIFDGDEITVIVRGKVDSAAVWSDGTNHNLVSIYSWPFANDLTIDISVAGLLEWTMMNSGFPGIILRQVAGGDLSWMTCGMTISHTAGELRAYKNGAQQGATISAGIAWASAHLWQYGCMFGSPAWKGWLADGIISFGVVASPAQMQSIHNALNAGTLTAADLDAIFGSGKYAWWKADEESISTELILAERDSELVLEGRD